MIKVSDLIDEVIKVYCENGIVTRNEIPAIDTRPFGRSLKEAMEEHGYPEATYREVEIGNWKDYSGVLFDPDRYSEEEAEEYMCKHVLSRNL